MVAFAAAVATSSDARHAAREAGARALASLGGERPVLAIAFASPGYGDLDSVPAALEAELGAVPVTGGTSGGAIFDSRGVYPRGVLVALLGGRHVSVTTVTTPIESSELVEVVPAGQALRAAAERAAGAGHESALCLAFAPAIRVDGESRVAAVRKGTGAGMQLAGALTGDDFDFDRPRVFADGGARSDRVVLTGVFTQDPVGVAARHGCPPIGPPHVVTRSDGAWVVALDGRAARDVWLADARAAGFRPPADPKELLAEVASRYPLGVDVPSHVEPLVRAPMGLRADGAVLLAASVPEGTRVTVMHASADQMLEAARWAARLARERAGDRCTGGLVLSCSGRLRELGDRFPEEPEAIGQTLEAPVAGACVFGEIARARREVDAFHNTTAIVIAWPRTRPRPGP